MIPWKVWYVAPHFRYERPQKGRYRQHWQVGAEALGVDDPQLDVEVIALAHGFYRALGLRDVHAEHQLDGRRRRPRRVRRERCAGTCSTTATRSATSFRERVDRQPAAGARLEGPRLAGRHRARAADHRVPGRRTPRTHFEAVQHGLDRLGIAHEINPRLVRGLDYYTSTTFEFSSQALDAAQNGIGGGGRYDKLVEQMGGKPTPGIGFGIGIERVLIACAAEGVVPGDVPVADVFVVDGMDNATEVTLLVTELREDGMRAERTYGGRSLKAQMKVADKSGARFTVILGSARPSTARWREGHGDERPGRGASTAGRRMVAGTTRGKP